MAGTIDSLVIERFVDIDELVALEADAKADGRKMVSRFVEEWLGGRNRVLRSPGFRARRRRRKLHASLPRGS